MPPASDPLTTTSNPIDNLAALDLSQEGVEERQRPGLLSIPVEVRLRIFQYVFDFDHLRICPHDDRQLVVLTRHIRERIGRVGAFDHVNYRWWGGYSQVKRHDPLPSLRPSIVEKSLVSLFLNHQIQNELSDAIVLYLEHCFTYFESYKHLPYDDPHSLHRILTSYNSRIWHSLANVGFSINQEYLHLPKLEEAAISRFKDGFSWLNSHMPNLQSTYLNLFCGPVRRPTDRFLAHLINAVKQLRGRKILTIHGTNRSKKAIANQWRHCIQDSDQIYIIGGCHCHAFASVKHDYVHNWKGGPPSRADTLSSWFTNWTEEKAKLAVEGAPMVRINRSCGGPLIGCLLCRVGTHCIHDRKYDSCRIVPTLSASGQPLLFDADGNQLPAVRMECKRLLVSPEDGWQSVQQQLPLTEEERKYFKDNIDWQERNEKLPREQRESWYEEEEWQKRKVTHNRKMDL